MVGDTTVRQGPMQYLNEHQVAEMVGVSVSTLPAHRHQRRGLPYHKFEGRVLYTLEDVQDALAKRRISFNVNAA